ncbi:MAG: DNA repair protein RecN [Actinomycetota bacterium]
MLRELHIGGLGVVDELALEFHPGLNVLTGETGTGKTMVTVGLALALGSRGSTSLVRSGAKFARVQALFDATAASDDAGWSEDGALVLARQIGADGKGGARVGGQIVPVSTLAELGTDLVEVHGQHEGIRLLSPAAQVAFVDRYAGADHLRALADLGASVGDLRAARDALADLRTRAAERERERDLVAFQVRELEEASPRVGELAELGAEAARLDHAERLLERAAEAEEAIADDGAAAEALARAAVASEAIAAIDADATDLAGRARELTDLAVDLGRDLRRYRESVSLDPTRLEEVRARIGALQGLLRKYGGTEDEAVASLASARTRLDELEGSEERAGELETRIATLERRVEDLSGVVSAGRASAAGPLAAAVQAELRELGMPDARVEVALVALAEVGSGGAERPEIRFSGGENQPLLPLAKVASGGELSRTMLALRSVLIDLDDVPTLVFDEVDAGIGGRAGVAVGRRLARLAASRQVLVVTHLPQIASFADRHIRVEKGGGTARVEVRDDRGRVAELTRMLSGLPGSDAAATHAEELLAEAGRAKAGG